MKPSPNGDNGHGPNGRFARGNKLGKGNPFARKVARYRKELFESVTVDDFKAIIRKLVALAIDGDIAAAKVLIDRLCGPVRTEIDATVNRGPVGVIELPMREFLEGFETETFEKEPNE